MASENIIGRFIQFKQITDIQTSTHSQFIINEFLNGGHMGPHLDYLRKIYKNKRDLMLNELNKGNLEGMTITVPNGGYFIWLRLPDYIRMNEFVKGLADKGVVVMLGDIFYPGYSIDGNYIRLNFSYPSEKDIKEGISILKNCIKQYSTCSLKKKYAFEAEINPFL